MKKHLLKLKLPRLFGEIKGLFILICLSGIMITSCQRDLSDPFVPKDKKFKTQFKFDQKKNRIVENRVSFKGEKGKFKDTFAGSKSSGRKKGGSKDSFSSKSKRLSSSNKFSSSKGRVVSYKSNSSGNRGSKESFSGVTRNESKMYRFDQKTKRTVAKGNFSLFGSRKYSGGIGSYADKKKSSGGMYAFNEKKRQVTKTKSSSDCYKRFKDEDSFGGKRNSSGSEFAYNAKKKRVTKSSMLFKPRDTDPGSFGHKGGIQNSVNKQHTFSNKQKRINHHNGIVWELFGNRQKVSKKKKESHLELFDPNTRNQMRLGR